MVRFKDESAAKAYLTERGFTILKKQISKDGDVGLKLWGAIDYLVNTHHYTFFRVKK